MSRARGVTRVLWRVTAVAGLALIGRGFGGVPRIGWPPGSTAVIDWVAAHDGIDVPYVRDCHGIFRRPVECPGATEARER